MRRSYLYILMALMLVSAGLRFINLTHLPPGLNGEEQADLGLMLRVKSGEVASFYAVPSDASGREGLYPIAQAFISLFVGHGVLGLRILSVWCGMVAIAAMFALTRRLFGTFAALTAAASLGVSFWPTLLARSAVRETLLLPLVIILLYLLVQSVHMQRDRLTLRSPQASVYMLLGVVAVMMAYTHWQGLLALPLVLLYFGLLLLLRQPLSRRIFSVLSFMLLLFIILVIPYIVFTARAFPLSGLATWWIYRPPTVLKFAEGIFTTLWSIVVRGDQAITHNLPGAAFLGIFGVITLFIGLFTSLRKWRSPNHLLVLLTFVVGLVSAAWMQPAPNFSNMLLLIPPIMALIGLGARTMAMLLFRTDMPITHPLAIVTLLVLIGIRTITTGHMLFTLWPLESQVNTQYTAQLGYLAEYLDRYPDNLTTTICTLNLNESRAGVADPQLMRMLLHRSTHNLRFSNCLFAMVIVRGGERQRIAFAEPEAFRAMSPILAQYFIDHKTIAVPGMNAAAGVWEIDIAGSLADALGRVTLSQVMWEPDAQGNTGPVPLPVRMGYDVHFLGYRARDLHLPYRRGDVIVIGTFWRIDGPQVDSLKIFAHLQRNPNTEPLLQNDVLNVEAQTLQPRDILIQFISLPPIPLDFPTGEYLLSIGAYRGDRGERFPVYDHDQMRGNRLFLPPIQIE